MMIVDYVIIGMIGTLGVLLVYNVGMMMIEIADDFKKEKYNDHR